RPRPPAGPWPPVRSRCRARADVDLGVAQGHHLPGADLRGLARLLHAIHAHGARRHQGLSGAAAVAEAGELEELVELDVVALEFEIDVRRPGALSHGGRSVTQCVEWR